MRQTPIFEQMLIDDGILLRKYWFSVSDAEQLRRFRVPAGRSGPALEAQPDGPGVDQPLGGLLAGQGRDDGAHRHPASPWFVVESDIKKHARLNMMAHLLSSIPYEEVPSPQVELPNRLVSTSNYQRPPRELATYVPDHAASLIAD